MTASCVHRQERRFFAQLVEVLTVSHQNLVRREKKVGGQLVDLARWLQSLRRRRRQPRCRQALNKSFYYHHLEKAQLTERSKTLVNLKVRVAASIQKYWRVLRRLERECEQECQPR